MKVKAGWYDRLYRVFRVHFLHFPRIGIVGTGRGVRGLVSYYTTVTVRYSDLHYTRQHYSTLH